MRRITGIIFIVATLISGYAYGGGGSSLKGGIGYLSLYGTLGDLSAVNRALKSRGFPEFGSGACFGLGGGGYFQMSKSFGIGIKGGSICGYTSSGTNRYKVLVEGGYLLTTFAYIKPYGKNTIIADAGLGYGGITANVQDKTLRQGDFYTHYIAKTSGLMGGVSLTALRWLKEGFFIGLQAELMYPLSGMVMEGEKISAIYNIGIVIGGGYIGR